MSKKKKDTEGFPGFDYSDPDTFTTDDVNEAELSPPVDAPELIGFVGYKGCGKDLAASVLPDHEVVKMADCLKDMLRLLFKYGGIDDDTIEEMIEGDLKEEPCELLGGRTPRWAMQSLGTEWGRDLIWDNIWINLITQYIKNAVNPVVITDVRFVNEGIALRDIGVKLVRITRDGHGFSNHKSEMEIENIKVDAIIGNNGTKDEFKDQVRMVLASIK